MFYARHSIPKIIVAIIFFLITSIFFQFIISFTLSDEVSEALVPSDNGIEETQGPANPTKLVQPTISIEDYKLDSIANFEVAGRISIVNDSSNIYSDLWFASTLFLKEDDHNTNINKNYLINKQEQQLSLNKMDRKVLMFKHLYPNNLPSGKYFIALNVYDKLGTAMAYCVLDLGDIGTKKDFIILDRYKSYLIWKNKKCTTLGGPSYRSQETPVLGISLTNNSSKMIKSKIQVKIFDRNMEFSSTPKLEKNIGECTLNANEEKIVEVNIPNVGKPGSYYVVVRLINEDGNIISNILEARYVVTGISAKFVDVQARKNKSNIEINTQIVGPADGESVNGALLRIMVSNNSTKVLLYEDEKNIDIGSAVISSKFNFPISDETTGIIDIYHDINNEGKIITSLIKTLSIEEILTEPTPLIFGKRLKDMDKSVETGKVQNMLTDSSGTKFEQAIRNLVSLDIGNCETLEKKKPLYTKY